MILEEQEKIEIVEDTNTNNSEFKPVKNLNHHSLKHVLIIIAIFIAVACSLALIVFGIFTIYNYSNNSAA